MLSFVFFLIYVQLLLSLDHSVCLFVWVNRSHFPSLILGSWDFLQASSGFIALQRDTTLLIHLSLQDQIFRVVFEWIVSFLGGMTCFNHLHSFIISQSFIQCALFVASETKKCWTWTWNYFGPLTILRYFGIRPRGFYLVDMHSPSIPLTSGGEQDVHG